MADPEQQLVVLPDGRSLCFAEYGDPSGVPVVSCHGGMSSRLDAAAYARAATALGVRLVSPDRPGVGGSDPLPGRRLLDWPADVTALADALNIERFAVIGWSLGGSYAAACCSAMPERITALALIAGVVPLEIGGMKRGLNRPDRLLLLLSRRAPGLARRVLERQVRSADAERVEETVERALGAADIAALRSDPRPTPAARFVQESMREGPMGVVEEYRLWGRSWGFSLRDITVPATAWQGDADTLVPPTYPRVLAETIPGAELRICPGEGHISILYNACERILSELMAMSETEAGQRISGGRGSAGRRGRC